MFIQDERYFLDTGMFLPVFIEEIDDLILEAIDLDEVKGDVESLDEGDNDNDNDDKRNDKDHNYCKNWR